jgi:DNA-directed RNA polymerase subunit RPC12/RpoP
MVKCKYCGYKNIKGIYSCSYCGRKIKKLKGRAGQDLTYINF